MSIADAVPMLTAFLAGTATGAAGQYFAMKFTDKRHEKERGRKTKHAWRTFEKQFPELAAEMREDYARPNNKFVRAFFVKHSKETLNGSSEPFFEYHTDKHPNIHAAMLHLEQNGFVSDITPGNCPMYRVHDALLRIVVPGH